MPLLNSWITSANTSETPFPLNNLPYGVFNDASNDEDEDIRCGVAIGDMILDVTLAEEEGLLELEDEDVFAYGTWDLFMDLGPDAWAAFRTWLQDALAQGSDKQAVLEPLLVPLAPANMHMPFNVAEYTDFYAGRQHAANMGAILRGSPDLPANWLHIPIGYNGRASSVVVSGTDIHRPNGQMKAPDADIPSFGPLLAPPPKWGNQ